MKKSTKKISLFLVLAMVLTLITSCNSIQNQEAPPPPTQSDAGIDVTKDDATPEPEQIDNEQESQAPNQYPLVDEPTTLTYWNSWSSAVSPYLNDYNETKSFQKAEEITGVHLECHIVSDEVKETQFNLMVVSQDYCDIVDTRNYTGGGDKAIEDSFLIRLNELIEEFAPNYNALRTRDTDTARATITDGGNLYGFFTIYDESDGPTTFLGLATRKDWLDQIGMEAPATYDEYYDMLTAYKVELGVNGSLMLGNAGVPLRNHLIGGYGVAAYMANTFMVSYPFYQVEGQVKSGLIEDGLKDYLEMMSKWYSEDLINKEYITQDLFFGAPPFQQAILTDQVGLMTIPVMMFSDLEDMAPTDEFEIVALSDPVKQKGDKTHFIGEEGQALVATDRVLGITTGCDNPELAVKWMDFWFSDEGVLLTNYGVENEGFVYDINGQPQLTELITNNPDSIPTNVTTVLYRAASMASRNYYSLLTQGMNENQEAARDIWNTDKDGAYDLPFSLVLGGNDAMEFANIYGDIQTFAQESILGFITGSKPMSEWDSYVKIVKDLKIDECVKIYQQTLDRYNAR